MSNFSENIIEWTWEAMSIVFVLGLATTLIWRLVQIILAGL